MTSAPHFTNVFAVSLPIPVEKNMHTLIQGTNWQTSAYNR